MNAVPAHAQWRRLDSPNFVVIGNVAARDLRDVAVQFEGFRETLTRVLSARVTTTAVPTVVVVFPSDQALAPFRPKYQGKPVEIAGLFVPGRDLNYILLVNDGRPDRLPVVLHEVHPPHHFEFRPAPARLAQRGPRRGTTPRSSWNGADARRSWAGSSTTTWPA